MTEGYFKQTGLHKFFLRVSLYAWIIHILSVNLLAHHLDLSSNLSVIYLASIYLYLSLPTYHLPINFLSCLASISYHYLSIIYFI